MTITLAPVTPATWPDLERLFTARGGPGHCWCMVWRDMPGRAGAAPSDRQAALRARVMAGTPVGLVLAVDGAPVGWCSIGPQDSFRALTNAPAEPGLWCLTCFFLHRDHRGQGLSARLLLGALDMARAAGATAVEATPVDPASPSYRFMGFTDLFLRHGFAETGRVGARRHVMRLEL
jgi:GNAT superfamily N-acetyltransferase